MNREVISTVEAIFPKEVGGVTPIVEFPQGITEEDLNFHLSLDDPLTGNPEYNTNQRNQEILSNAFKVTRSSRPNDSNDPKATLRQLEVVHNKLSVDAGLTDFFTLWGIPKTSPDFQKKTIKEIVLNRKTEKPLGISTHNILINNDGKIAVRKSSKSGAFSSGTTSVTLEEQMDPNKDMSPFNTALRGFYEEQGIIIPSRQIRLLGIAAETNTSYAAFCFVGLVDLSESEILKSWRSSPDHNETNSLNMFTIGKTLNLINQSKINLHPTVQWRLSLLQKFISAI